MLIGSLINSTGSFGFDDEISRWINNINELVITDQVST